MVDDGAYAALRQSIVSVLPEVAVDMITGDRTLDDLGCNSIDRAEIVVLAMERLGVTIPMSSIRQGQRLEELAELLEAHR